MPRRHEIKASSVRNCRKSSGPLGEDCDSSIEAGQLSVRAKIEWALLIALRPAVRNPHTHSKKQIRQIADSIEKFGFINPIVIDEHGRLVAGHGRFEAAKLLGLREVPVIRLSHLSEAAIRAYMLADNRLAEKAGWDRELLAIELSELELLLPQINLDLSITGFEPSEIDSIMLDFGSNRPDPADELPKPEKKSVVSQRGDLFILGRHRMLRLLDAG